MFAGYKGSVSHFVFVLVVACMNCSFAFQPFNLTRLDLDKFQNPTVTKCHDFQGGKEYCAKRLAACDWDRGCCECLCGDYSQSTFDVLAHKCRKNTYFRAGTEGFKMALFDWNDSLNLGSHNVRAPCM